MSFRKEKKYRLLLNELIELKKILFKKGMTKLYPKRIINSCYFDTNNYLMFKDSEEGVLPRKKIRVRWYDNIKKSKKEIKISSIEGRYKISKNLKSINSIKKLFHLTFDDNFYGCLFPSLLTKYEREYFKLNGQRITFDKNISYTFLRSSIKPKIDDKECVIEIKSQINCSDDFIEKIISIPTSRFSKYSRGLLNTENILRL